MQSTNLSLIGRNESRRLSHVNLFLKNAIKESIVDIMLLKRPIVRNSKRENQPNSNRFDYRRKGLLVIKM